MILVHVDLGPLHLVEPRTVDGFACNAGRSGRRKATRQLIDAAAPTCGRCLAMLRQGDHPNLPSV